MIYRNKDSSIALNQDGNLIGFCYGKPHRYIQNLYTENKFGTYWHIGEVPVGAGVRHQNMFFGWLANHTVGVYCEIDV